MAKNKQSNLIGSVKMLNISAIEKFAINLGMGRELFSISKLPIIFLQPVFISLTIIFLFKLWTE